jgi:hypothetical protein
MLHIWEHYCFFLRISIIPNFFLIRNNIISLKFILIINIGYLIENNGHFNISFASLLKSDQSNDVDNRSLREQKNSYTHVPLSVRVHDLMILRYNLNVIYINHTKSYHFKEIQTISFKQSLLFNLYRLFKNLNICFKNRLISQIILIFTFYNLGSSCGIYDY